MFLDTEFQFGVVDLELFARRDEQVLGNPGPFVIHRCKQFLEFVGKSADFLQCAGAETPVHEVDEHAEVALPDHLGLHAEGEDVRGIFLGDANQPNKVAVCHLDGLHRGVVFGMPLAAFRHVEFEPALVHVAGGGLQPGWGTADVRIELAHHAGRVAVDDDDKFGKFQHAAMVGLDAGNCAFLVLFRVVHRGTPAYAGALADELKRMFGNSDDFD